MVENLKVALCSTEILVRRRGLNGLMTEIPENILSRPAETATMMVPCFLYFLQNNLLLLAVASLGPPVYYVVSQLKILATATFSIAILKKTISGRKWTALCMLILGTVVTQANFDYVQNNVNSLGLGAAICAVLTSGLAGVLCEYLLKAGDSFRDSPAGRGQ